MKLKGTKTEIPTHPYTTDGIPTKTSNDGFINLLPIPFDITFTNMAKAIAIGALITTAPTLTNVEPKMKAKAPKEGEFSCPGFQLLVNRNSDML